MKKQCVIIRSSSDYGSPYNRHLCVDLDSADEIYELIDAKRKKFWYIVERTLTNANLYWDSYDKESVNSKTKNVSAIKFFDSDNTRIYCRELTINETNFLIVCSVAINKKVQKNDKRIDEIIKSVQSYEYEIVEEG